MKLYNIYESIILEEGNTLLTENKRQNILDAFNGGFEVWFDYKDADGGVTSRYVQIYDIGKSKSEGSPEMLSVWQKGGDTAKTKSTSEKYGWKQFLLNNIVDGSVKITTKKFNKAVSDLDSFNKGNKKIDNKYPNKFNPNGNKNMVGDIMKVNFNK